MTKLDKNNIRSILALTPLQEGLLYHYLKDSKKHHYIEQITLTLSGEINFSIFSQAWNIVCEQNEMLRVVFRWERLEKPTQIVLKKYKPLIKRRDISSFENSEDQQLQLEGVKKEERNLKFNLREVPFRITLCTASHCEHYMIVTNHHILYDGWSNGIILKEFFQTYEALLDENFKPNQLIKPSYGEFINLLKQQRKEDQKIFWKNYLQDFDSHIQLPVAKPNHESREIESQHLQFILEKGIMEKLTHFLHENKITEAAFFYSAWGMVLQKYCGSEDIVFGTTVSGRSVPVKGIENMVGLFINTVPIRVTSHTGETVLELLHRVNESLLLKENYDSTPLVDIKEYSSPEANRELFDTLLVVENYPLDYFLQKNNHTPPVKIKCYSTYESTNYALNIAITLHSNIEIRFIYNSDSYTEDVIFQLFRHLNQIMMVIIEQPASLCHSLDILTRGEKIQLLADFNKSDPGYPVDKTIHGLFLEQVNRTPDSPALVGKTAINKQNSRKNIQDDIIIITYHQLDRKSSQLSAGLPDKIINKGAPVAVMLERTIEMMAVILGILKTGCAYVPLNPQAPSSRNQYVLDDCAVDLLITDQTNATVSKEINVIHPQDLLINQEESEKYQTHHIFSKDVFKSIDSLAYIIYTSGSTGKPRGVPITHSNFSPLVHWGYQQLNLKPTDRSVQNLSYYFDWSVWEMFIVLTSGATLYMVTGDIVIDSEKYLDYIQQHAITILHITPTHFQSVLHANPGNRLKSLTYLCIGAEKLNTDLVERSYQWLNSDCRIFNMYGPTEATIMAAVLDIDKNQLPLYTELTSVPIGEPLGNTILLILDKHLNVCPLHVPGELYIGGDGVSRGYLNNPELTAEKFCLLMKGKSSFEKSLLSVSNADIPESHSTTQLLNHSTIYKSGDLARWLPEGVVEFLGRIDQQVKIRGFRIEPAEIENRLLKHPEIKEALVIARENESGDKYLCAYLVPHSSRTKNITLTAKEFVSASLPKYMVPTSFILLDTFPLNPNGKVDIKALPDQAITSDKNYIAPRNEAEQTLTEIWAGILEMEAHRIGIEDDFFELGGHSLKVTSLIGRIHKRLKVEIPFTEIFVNPTLREQAAYINRTNKSHFDGIRVTEEKEYYPLSPAQRRLFVLQQMEPSNVAYNICGILLLKGELEREKFESIFLLLVSRHESLRTSFHLVNEQPVQRINKKDAFKIDYETIEIEEKIQNTNPSTPETVEPLSNRLHPHTQSLESYIEPFDLTQAPLFRVKLVQTGAETHLLLVDMHHIISDGTSIKQLVDDFITLYKGNSITPLRVHYRDYTQWYLERKKAGLIEQQKAYWAETYCGEIPLINLPTDFPRPVIQRFSGAHKYFKIDIRHSYALIELALEEKTTPFVVLLTLFYIFLSKLSNQDDLVIGTPIDGRIHSDITQVIGMFVNMLPLRTYPAGEKKFNTLLQEVRDTAFKAFENQEYPFEELVELLNIKRETSRNPIFDVAFTLEEGVPGFTANDIPGIEITTSPDERNLSKFDLTLIGTKENNVLRFTFEYCTELYKETTIERWINYFKSLISQVIVNKQIKIGDLELISPAEKKEILFNFNRFEPEFETEKTIQQLFGEQVEQNPNQIALVESSDAFKNTSPKEITGSTSKGYLDIYGRQHVSYKQLNIEAQNLANHLLGQEVKSGELIGILTSRSIEMIVGILAILKAGCGYVPLNPEAPSGRNRYILEECNIHLLLSNCQQDEWKENFTVIDLKEFCQNRESTRDNKNDIPLSENSHYSASALAYVIYTSGSTGKPKGVPISHSNLSPLLHWGYRHLDIGPSHHTMQNLSYFFDWSVWEICITITTGATLYIAPEEVALNTDRCTEFLKANAITVMHITPTQYSYLLKTGMKTGTLHYLFIGAEKLTLDLAQRSLAAVSPHCRVFNLYGPTEATIISAALEIHPNEIESYTQLSSIPIGKPAGNTDLLILDNYFKLCPVNLPGELYIGGDCIAQGYLNNPELTAEKFCLRQPGDSFYKNRPLDPRKNGLFTHSTIYKTGDLARWLDSGKVEYLGRIDYQIKIRGFRIELGEIENQILSNQDIKETLVIDRENQSGEKFICAYIVPKESVTESLPSVIEKLKAFLKQRLPDYMIPSNFVPIKNLPLNPNGKVDRKSLPQIDNTQSTKPYSAPQKPVEKKLVELWNEILERATNPESQPIGIDDSFFEIGGHSLKAIQMTAKIHKEFHVKLPLVDIFSSPTIRELATIITKATQYTYQTLEPVEKKEYYPLSSAQKRMYILQQMDKQGTGIVNNIPSAWLLTGEINLEKLTEAFRLLMLRHESLRTSFYMVNETPVQRIHENATIKIEKSSLTLKNIENNQEKPLTIKNNDSIIKEQIKHLILPFDVSKTPLVRINLVELTGTSTNKEEQQTLLIFDIHHIISDGTSMNVLVKDLMKLYRNQLQTPLKNQYKDYSERHGNPKINFLKSQEQYWLNEFSGEIPALEIPIDFTRPPILDFKGNSINLKIPAGTTHLLRTLAVETGTTLYILLLTAYSILLSKLSNQEDIVIGTPVAGRQHADLEPLTGMFVNTLAIRNYPSGGKQFGHFLKEVKEKTLQAFENQNYQYEDLVEQAVIDRDLGRNPLFDTMLVFQNTDNISIEIPGLKITPYEYENQSAKFDLTVTIEEIEEELRLKFAYRTSLFKKETIQRYAAYFQEVIKYILENKESLIAQIEVITPEERKRILDEFNATTIPYSENKTVTELLNLQALNTPEQISLIAIERHHVNTPRNTSQNKAIGINSSIRQNIIHLTYNELNLLTENYAYTLLSNGIRPDTIVAIKVLPSIEMIIGILAILKAGGAYLPIDPGLPEERINFMLTDSNTAYLLSTEDPSNEAIHITTGMQHLRLPHAKEINDKLRANSWEQKTQSLNPFNIAYIIYTSGTTGRPKGVMVEHRQAVNTLLCRKEEYQLNQNTIALQLFSFSFDGFVTGFFTPIISGAKVIILSEDVKKDISIVCNRILTQQVSHFISVPALYHAILETTGPEGLKSVRVVTLAGDTVSPGLVKQSVQHHQHIEIALEYGVTEAAVMSTLMRHQEQKLEISIGKPTWNTTIYILGSWGETQPVGVPGELHIGGKGLARGYLNNPELTQSKYPILNNKPNNSQNYRLYRSGDLASWLTDGCIRFLGRIDHQVKIRGFRVEVGEIENRILKIQGIKEAIVLAQSNNANENYLCAYYISEIQYSIPEIQKKLETELPGYMIPSYFIQLEKLPLTSTGKINRRSLPKPELTNKESYTPPASEIEKKIVEIWSRVLRISTDVIGLEDNFFHLGGHSLKATLLANQISQVFNIEFHLTSIFSGPTVKEIAEIVQKSQRSIFDDIYPLEKKEYYPMSSAQKRLFFLEQLENIGTSYNAPTVLKVNGQLDKVRFINAIEELIKRHEALRTSFNLIADEPVQIIHDKINYVPEIETIDNKTQNINSCDDILEYSTRFLKPFDLSRAPLLRIVLVTPSEGDYFIFYDTHHIISDGTSMGTLITDFIKYYFQTELTPLKLQYKDFTIWQNHRYQSGLGKKQEEYWLEVYRDIYNGAKVPRLNLPTDFPRPTAQSFTGEQYEFKLGSEKLNELNRLNSRYGTTLYMILMALFNVLLFKYTDQEDIILGSGIDERIHKDLQGILGMFVNTLPIRNYPKPELSFSEFLNQVKENCIGAFENQNMQFEELVERLKIKRDPSRNPLFDVEFNLQNFMTPEDQEQIPLMEQNDENPNEVNLAQHHQEVSFINLRYPNKTSKFDMILFAEEIGEEVLFSLEYSTTLFKRETIAEMKDHFFEILEQVTSDEEIVIKNIQISHDFATATPELEINEFGF